MVRNKNKSLLVFAVLFISIFLGVVSACTVGACACGDGICEDGENHITCAEDCSLECEGADYIFNVDLEVVGEGCVSGYSSVDSEIVNVDSGNYRVEVRSHRGNPGQNQTEERFYIEINSQDSSISEDDSDASLEITKWEDMGEFNFMQGDNEIILHSVAPSCPPWLSANSVDINKICLYKIEVPEPTCGDGTLDDGEQCDDGNDINDDGCSSTCEIEVPEPYCGNGELEIGEQCDWGALNGFLCWAGYGSSCNYCTSTCKLKTITNYCGDGIKQACEECDDGNTASDDGCSSTCEIETPEPTCDHEIAVKYSYTGTFDTGLGVSENGIWLEGNTVNLLEEEIHSLKYRIDNKESADDNVHIVVKLDGEIISEYDKIINEYHTKEINFNTEEICGVHTLSLTIESDGYECDLSDNYAEREINIICEDTPEPVCGNGIVEQGEECDGGSNCNSDCTLKDEEEEEDDDKKSTYNKLSVGFCTPNWVCSGWNLCSSGVQTRTCYDSNFCETEYNKPMESRGCIEPVLEKAKVKETNLLWFIVGVIMFIILLIILTNIRK